MITFILAFAFIAIMIAGMAIGVILQNKPIKGSCGGMAALSMDTACDLCGGNPKKCEEEQERQALEKPNADLAYDASVKK